jgi:polyphosphate kinase
MSSVVDKVDLATSAPHMPAGEVSFLDRDLSWLEFNRRVLNEASDRRTPLLERLRFLGIFSANLDEFFMKRVGPLRRRRRKTDPDDQATRTLDAIRTRVLAMLAEQWRCFEEIQPALNEHGIRLLSWSQLTDGERDSIDRWFRANAFPVLTPQAVDPAHPFPFISNLSVSLAVALRSPDSDERIFARVKLPPTLPSWVEVPNSPPGERRYLGLRELVRYNLPMLFPGMVVEEVIYFRVTRNADLEVEEGDNEEDRDVLETVEEELRRRRLEQVVRVEHSRNADPWLLRQVVEAVGVSAPQVYELPGYLDYAQFRDIASLKMPGLTYPAFVASVPAPLADENADVFAAIRAGDILVHHPYESFDATVGRFLRAAVEDPQVLAIKVTFYRAGDESPFIPKLIEAAVDGKQVACLIELKARFDEQRNIRWATALEDAGVHVVYGIVGMKTHAKTAVVVRREPEGLRSYAMIGTGNLNPQTAKVYTDLSLLTCDPEIGEDCVELFHGLTGRSLKRTYKRLLVAPLNLKERMLELIRREVLAAREGRPAHIIAKMNQLEDEEVCNELYAASRAGVPIDLIVRGLCTLRPGLPGLSPTIRVISILGRFLEHSRIFYFRNGRTDPLEGDFFIGSADWMRRNLHERVEVVVPIQGAAQRKRLWDILQVMLEDRRQAWDMQSDGSYKQRRPEATTPAEAALGTHQALLGRGQTSGVLL